MAVSNANITSVPKRNQLDWNIPAPCTPRSEWDSSLTRNHFAYGSQKPGNPGATGTAVHQ